MATSSWICGARDLFTTKRTGSFRCCFRVPFACHGYQQGSQNPEIKQQIQRKTLHTGIRIFLNVMIVCIYLCVTKWMTADRKSLFGKFHSTLYQNETNDATVPYMKEQFGNVTVSYSCVTI